VRRTHKLTSYLAVRVVSATGIRSCRLPVNDPTAGFMADTAQAPVRSADPQHGPAQLRGVSAGAGPFGSHLARVYVVARSNAGEGGRTSRRTH
jgi:hypothetical protein